MMDECDLVILALFFADRDIDIESVAEYQAQLKEFAPSATNIASDTC